MCRTPRNKGGLGYMQIPILADTTKVGVAIPGMHITVQQPQLPMDSP